MKYSISELTEIIENRRTIFPEQFSDRKVHKEQIEKLLNAAKWAPTHRITQPWRFTVFMEEGLTNLAEFQSNLYKNMKSPEEFSQQKIDKIINRFSRTSAVIVVGAKNDELGKVPFKEELAATAAAIQNMALMATAFGLAFYWSTGAMTYSEELKLFVNLEKNDQVMGQIYIGYPSIDWPRKTKRKPLEYYTNWRLD